MKKGESYEGVVERVNFPNIGIVHLQETDVAVKNVIPGQRIRFRIRKKRKNYYEGILLEVLEKSSLQTEEVACRNFPACGGCTYQTIPYEQQLFLKEKQVQDLLGKIPDLCEDYQFDGIYGSPRQWGYRNKMEFTFGDEYKDGPLSLGLHRKGGLYDVLTTDDCRIVPHDFTVILRRTLDYFRQNPQPYYRKMQREGYLRHLLIRRSQTTGRILVDLVTTSQAKPDLSGYVSSILSLEAEGQLEGNIAGILHIVNDSPADVVQSDETRILYGKDCIYEEILGLKFKISSFSFFQTNTLGAQVLYQIVRSYLGETKNKVVFDLYSGTGTIAQVLALAAKEVIGVEIVKEAVEDARENAAQNHLHNCTFIEGDVLKVVPSLDQKPDLIVLDPPRDGVHPKVLPKILDFGAPKIVYISCKPTSLTRDLTEFFKRGYQLERVSCVDLFPETVHVETCALLSLKE